MDGSGALRRRPILFFEKRFETRSSQRRCFMTSAQRSIGPQDLIRDDFPAGVGFNHYTYTLKRYKLFPALPASHQKRRQTSTTSSHDVLQVDRCRKPDVRALLFISTLLLAVPLVTAFFCLVWRRRLMPDGGVYFWDFGTAMLIAYLHSLF